jgi:hypothetical protein
VATEQPTPPTIDRYKPRAAGGAGADRRTDHAHLGTAGPGATIPTATAASTRYGWPLQVIDDVGHFAAEQPQAFAAALRTAFDCP